MAWIIDADHLADKDAPAGTNCNAVGVTGPKGSTFDPNKETFEFRMYDDDGTLYYEGRSNSKDSFAPLDDFGAPNAGCTRIDYYNEIKKKWEIL